MCTLSNTARTQKADHKDTGLGHETGKRPDYVPGQDDLAHHELASILFIILVFSLEMTTHTHNKPSPCK